MIPNRIAGKWALISGGGSGIGRSIALLFARAGVNLHLLGRRIENLEAVAAEARVLNPAISVHSHVADVNNLPELESVVEHILKTPLDILVNNAGLALGLEPIDKYNPADIDKVIDTDVKALMQMTRIVGTYFRARNEGHIVNMSSIAGYEPYPGGSVYNAAKFAVNGFNKAIKQDFHGTNIRVSAVSPGMVQTDFSKVRFKGDEARAAKVYANTTPLSPDDVAELVYYMVNAAPHVNILDALIYPVTQSCATMVHRTA